jgi:hypothetical protein
MFGEWYQKTNKTEDTNKLTLLAFKMIIILHNTRFATFIKLLETVSKGLLGIDRRTAVTRSWIAAVRPLYPLERPGAHCTGGWVGPRAGLDVCEKSRPQRDSIPGPSSP